MAVRIALCGKGPGRAAEFIAAMQPEYEITHVFHSVEKAQEELPQVLSGEAVSPSSGLGTHADSAVGAPPVAVVVGAGFSDDEVNTMRKVKGADTIPWFQGNPNLVDRSQFQGGMPPTSSIADRCKVVLKRQEIAPGDTMKRDDTGLYQF